MAAILDLTGLVAVLLPRQTVPLWALVFISSAAVFGDAWDTIDGTYHLKAATEAEVWSSQRLRKMLGNQWRVVDSISFENRDVDHVVVGPTGVFAVETKYTDSVVDLDTRKGKEIAARWAAQASRGAWLVRWVVGDGRKREPVSPIVVVWGTEVRGTPATIEGVSVLRARDVRDHHWVGAAEFTAE